MRSWRVLLTLTLFTPGIPRAEDAPKKPWKATAEASLVTTNGNSKATSTSGKAGYNYDWGRALLDLNAGGLGTQSDQKVTAEQYFANEKVTWKFHDDTYLYERFAWDKNRFAGYRNRWDSSAGLGQFLINTTRHKLNAELGAGYLNEERIDAPRLSNGTGRAYGKYVWALTEKSAFSQDAEYLHSFKDSDAYRLNTETALQASITSSLALKTSFVWNRVAKPVAGTGKDDTKTLVSLVVNF